MYFKQEQFKNAGHGGNMNDNNQGAQNNSNANQTLDLKKTKICPVIKQGKRCPKGDKCNFAHSNEELRSKPNLTKTKMCPNITKNGHCELGENCNFAHSELELRSTPNLYKTALCNNFMSGECKLGEYCRFAHGEAELRIKQTVEPLPQNGYFGQQGFNNNQGNFNGYNGGYQKKNMGMKNNQGKKSDFRGKGFSNNGGNNNGRGGYGNNQRGDYQMNGGYHQQQQGGMVYAQSPQQQVQYYMAQGVPGQQEGMVINYAQANPTQINGGATQGYQIVQNQNGQLMAMPINMSPQMGHNDTAVNMPQQMQQNGEQQKHPQGAVISPGYQQYPNTPNEVMVSQEPHAQGSVNGPVNPPPQMNQNGYSGHHMQGQQYAIVNHGGQSPSGQAGQMGVAVPVQGMK